MGLPSNSNTFLNFHNTMGHTKLQDCGFSITTASYLIIMYINYV